MDWEVAVPHRVPKHSNLTAQHFLLPHSFQPGPGNISKLETPGQWVTEGWSTGMTMPKSLTVWITREEDSKAHSSPRAVTVWSSRSSFIVASLSTFLFANSKVRLKISKISSVWSFLWVNLCSRNTVSEGQGFSKGLASGTKQTMVFGLCSKCTGSNWLELLLLEVLRFFLPQPLLYNWRT